MSVQERWRDGGRYWHTRSFNFPHQRPVWRHSWEKNKRKSEVSHSPTLSACMPLWGSLGWLMVSLFKSLIQRACVSDYVCGCVSGLPISSDCSAVCVCMWVCGPDVQPLTSPIVEHTGEKTGSLSFLVTNLTDITHKLLHIRTHSSITGEVRHRWGAISVQTSWYLITVISPIMRLTHTHSLCPHSHAARPPLLKYTYTAAACNNTHTVSLANMLTNSEMVFVVFFNGFLWCVSTLRQEGRSLIGTIKALMNFNRWLKCWV